MGSLFLTALANAGTRRLQGDNWARNQYILTHIIEILLRLDSYHRSPNLATQLYEFLQVILRPSVRAYPEPATMEEEKDRQRPICTFRHTHIKIQTFCRRILELVMWQALLNELHFHVTASGWRDRSGTGTKSVITGDAEVIDQTHPWLVPSTTDEDLVEHISGAAKACFKDAYFRPRNARTWSPDRWVIWPSVGCSN